MRSWCRRRAGEASQKRPRPPKIPPFGPASPAVWLPLSARIEAPPPWYWHTLPNSMRAEPGGIDGIPKGAAHVLEKEIGSRHGRRWAAALPRSGEAGAVRRLGREGERHKDHGERDRETRRAPTSPSPHATTRSQRLPS